MWKHLLPLPLGGSSSEKGKDDRGGFAGWVPWVGASAMDREWAVPKGPSQAVRERAAVREKSQVSANPL